MGVMVVMVAMEIRGWDELRSMLSCGDEIQGRKYTGRERGLRREDKRKRPVYNAGQTGDGGDQAKDRGFTRLRHSPTGPACE